MILAHHWFTISLRNLPSNIWLSPLFTVKEEMAVLVLVCTIKDKAIRSNLFLALRWYVHHPARSFQKLRYCFGEVIIWRSSRLIRPRIVKWGSSIWCISLSTTIKEITTTFGCSFLFVGRGNNRPVLQLSISVAHVGYLHYAVTSHLDKHIQG